MGFIDDPKGWARVVDALAKVGIQTVALVVLAVALYLAVDAFKQGAAPALLTWIMVLIVTIVVVAVRATFSDKGS